MRGQAPKYFFLEPHLVRKHPEKQNTEKRTNKRARIKVNEYTQNIVELYI